MLCQLGVEPYIWLPVNTAAFAVATISAEEIDWQQYSAFVLSVTIFSIRAPPSPPSSLLVRPFAGC